MGKFAQFAGKLGSHHPDAGVVLAPMAGVTDAGMRRIAQKFGASYTVSEMIDADLFTAGERASRVKADGAGIACHVVQIAGCDPDRLADAARLAEAEGAAMVDINMGCPAKKVVGGLAGSALMRDLDRATALVRAVVGAVGVPVSLKMRLGWDDASRNAPELARRAEVEGVAVLSVHGRTRCQFYKGSADWLAIGAVTQAVSIPVLANGDCTSLADARRMLDQSGASAVMIGRAAVGRPWLVGAIGRELATGRAPEMPSAAEQAEAALDHYESLLAQFGIAHGIRHARKHLAGYATHAGHAAGSARHRALVTSEDAADVRHRLVDLFADEPLEMAA